MPEGNSPPPVCSRTRVMIPECCCGDCFEAQLRRFRPALLERHAVGRVASHPTRYEARSADLPNRRAA